MLSGGRSFGFAQDRLRRNHVLSLAEGISAKRSASDVLSARRREQNAGSAPPGFPGAARTRRAEFGRIYSALVCGPDDAFNIGSHIVALARGFFRAEVEAVTALGQADGHRGRPGTPFGQAGAEQFLVEQRDEAPLILQLSAGTSYADSPAYLGSAIEWAADQYEAWGHLDDAIRTGRPLVDPDLHLGDDPDALEVRSYWVLAGWHPPKD